MGSVILLAALAVGDVGLVPRPKEFRESGGTIRLEARGAIVVGKGAGETEQYAAERLAGLWERRFGVRAKVIVEGREPATGLAILVGCRQTHAWIDRACAERGIRLSADSPGADGFVVEMFEEAGRPVVVVGGSDARGAMYGCDVLFDLTSGEKGDAVIRRASVRDWPSIAWRGRPHSVLLHHLVPGALDAYVRARINFSDVRDNPSVEARGVMPARKASMGFEPGAALDRPNVKRVIDEDHRRGMFVYGTVSCSVARAQIPDVLATFNELIGLGVDGLWISFDDTGAGDAAPEVIRAVLELGKTHGMTGRRIAVTPPAGDYQTIDRPFNRQCAGIEGFAEAQWLFTRVPCAADTEMARSIGLKRLPGWWHNLVGFQGGFLHNAGVICTLRADGRPSYVDLQPLAAGWHSPDDEKLRGAREWTDTALLWGVVNGWPEEYEVGALGLWAWNPEEHDWPSVRDAIYGYVYGPGQAAAARRFDETLARLKTLFEMPAQRFEPNRGWPCRLKRVADRAEALRVIDELDGLSQGLRRNAPRETAIEPSRLETVYLEPMKATVQYARRMATLDYPEQWLADFENAVFARLDAGDRVGVERRLAAVRDKVGAQLERIEEDLAGLKGIDAYVRHWQERVAGLESWQRLARERRAAMEKRLKEVLAYGPDKLLPYTPGATAADLAALVARAAAPGPDGTLAELAAGDWLTQAPRFQGAFAVGKHDIGVRPLVAIAFPGGVPSRPGDFGEAEAAVEVPAYQGRLVLEAFVNDTRVDNRYPRFRFLQLLAEGKVVWEEDIARDRAGREWVTVDLGRMVRPGERLRLAFRVVDKRGVGSHASVAWLGPVRLRAVP